MLLDGCLIGSSRSITVVSPIDLFVALSYYVYLHFDRGYTFVQSYRTSLLHFIKDQPLHSPFSFPRRGPLRRTPNLRRMYMLKPTRHNSLLDELLDIQDLHIPNNRLLSFPVKLFLLHENLFVLARVAPARHRQR